MGMSNIPPQKPEAVLVDHHDLDPVVQETRELLAKGMHSRFFGRYIPKSLGKGDISYAYAMACALSPQSVRLKLIDSIVADPVFQLTPREQIEHSKALKRHIWSLIRELAIRAAEKIEEKRFSSEDPDVSSAKRRKTTSGPRSSFTRRSGSEFKGLGFLDNDDDEDRSGGEVDDSVVNVEEKVDEEIRRLQASFGPNKASDIATSSSSESGSMFQASNTFRTDEVLDFWLNINCHYSYLACVARCVLGLPASAEGIERDFVASGSLITPKRANLLSHNVEMMLFVNINDSIVPWDDPENIPTWQMNQDLPGRLREGSETNFILTEMSSNENCYDGGTESDDEELLGLFDDNDLEGVSIEETVRDTERNTSSLRDTILRSKGEAAHKTHLDIKKLHISSKRCGIHTACKREPCKTLNSGEVNKKPDEH
ncbi:hypothetical protein PsorP6_006987 [Peronosclerospora sorghi]|uniref:Uncharacterized protein n=1 Tax=Peronosclerospora sorghi TaxID=230839 RepID=A0ACC0W797_9STRA|nr:hypothetical protein PsorP6_006987 [Peronosclerospora sorghi]